MNDLFSFEQQTANAKLRMNERTKMHWKVICIILKMKNVLFLNCATFVFIVKLQVVFCKEYEQICQANIINYEECDKVFQ